MIYQMAVITDHKDLQLNLALSNFILSFITLLASLSYTVVLNKNNNKVSCLPPTHNWKTEMQLANNKNKYDKYGSIFKLNLKRWIMNKSIFVDMLTPGVGYLKWCVFSFSIEVDCSMALTLSNVE